MIRWLDRLALAGMAVGAGLMLQPWMTSCFRAGFFCLLGCTVVQIVTAHVGGRRDP